MEKLRINYNDGRAITRNITYNERIKIADKDLEIIDKETQDVMLRCSLEQVESISLDNTLRESTIEWIESFIKEYMYTSQYWQKELEAAWVIHDLITHEKPYVPCEEDDYTGYQSAIRGE